MAHKEQDFTPTGLRIDGAYENDRNADNADLYKDIIREVFGVSDVIIAHHLVYVAQEVRDGFTYQIVEEIPSADALIFDTDCAKKLWGDKWSINLALLAVTPVAKRDELLRKLYYDRPKNSSKGA